MNGRGIFLGAAWLGLALVWLTGCAWDKPNSGSFASVNIKNTTVAQVWTNTVNVFKDDDYQTTYSSLDQTELTFEKEGSRGESLAYNGLVGTHYGQGIANRVKARIRQRTDGSCVLSCQAYMIRDAGNSLAEESPMANIRSGPYQSLLDEVADRIKNAQKP